MTVIMSHATIWIRDAKRNPYSYHQLYQGKKLLKKRKKTYSKKFLKLLKDSQKNIKYFGKKMKIPLILMVLFPFVPSIEAFEARNHSSDDGPIPCKVFPTISINYIATVNH